MHGDWVAQAKGGVEEGWGCHHQGQQKNRPKVSVIVSIFVSVFVSVFVVARWCFISSLFVSLALWSLQAHPYGESRRLWRLLLPRNQQAWQRTSRNSNSCRGQFLIRFPITVFMF